MNGRIDLHLHTLYSDGRLTPTELVQELHRAQVTVAAITDHDTLDAWPEGKAVADELGIRLICATEMSVVHGTQDLHVLAYFVDPEDERFGKVLAEIRNDRLRRMEEMADRLVRLGIPVQLEPVLTRAGRGSVGRVHLAQELHERGWVRTFSDAFHHYIGDGGPAFRAKRTPSLARSLEEIARAGGVAVLAHPGVYQLEGLLETMVPLGLGGLEVYHPAHTLEQVREFERLAERWGLVKTGGTDYHGLREQEVTPGSIELGEEIVDELEAVRPPARTRGDTI